MKICKPEFIKKILTILLCILIVPFDFACAMQYQTFQEIEVKAGDTVWGVAKYYLKDPEKWPELLNFNKLPADPHTVLPGVKLKVPVLLIKEELRYSTVVSVVKDVKYRRASEMDWKDAKADLRLFNKDGIRTFEASRTDIKSPSGKMITVGPLSLVIIQPEEDSEETKLLSGSIRTKDNIPIRTPTAYIAPKISAKTPNADYKANVKEDQSTVVAVYKGSVDVTARNKTVTVNEGFSTEVKLNLPPMDPRPLPPMADMEEEMKNIENTRIASLNITPSSGSDIFKNVKSTSIADIPKPAGAPISYEINIPIPAKKTTNQASSLLDITHYHLQMAKDKDFSNIVLDEISPIYQKFDVRNIKLPDGKYFWRVSYIDTTGAEGILSSAKQVYLDKKPPVLIVEEPVDGAKYNAPNLNVTGITEPGASVEVNKLSALVTEGWTFIAKVPLSLGENTITVIAKDYYDNISTSTIKVTYSKEAKEQVLKGKRNFYSTPLGIIVSVVTISALVVITIVTIGG